MSKKKHINEQLKTGFHSQGNRIAGMGIEQDDYSEESFPDDRQFNKSNKMFWQRPIKIKTYTIKEYKLSDKELKYYKGDGEEYNK